MGGERGLWMGAEEGASRSCTETSSFSTQTASNAARTHFRRNCLLPGLWVDGIGQAVHVSQEICCKAANFREQSKSRFGA
jgi:hypothetical protein